MLQAPHRAGHAFVNESRIIPVHRDAKCAPHLTRSSWQGLVVLGVGALVVLGRALEDRVVITVVVAAEVVAPVTSPSVDDVD